MSKLKAPLSYQGGKGRLAPTIVERIMGDHGTHYIDLCCGSGAISVQLVNAGIKPEKITMVDISMMGKFWEQIGQGTFDLDTFSRLIDEVPSDRFLIKVHLEQLASLTWEDVEDVVPRYLLLQAGSFGGKQVFSENVGEVNRWKGTGFRDYWQPTETSKRRSPVNPMIPVPSEISLRVNRLVKDMKGIKGFQQKVEDFDWKAYDQQRDGKVVIFIDPPYEGTAGYGYDIAYRKWLEDTTSTLSDDYQIWITDYQEHGIKSYVLNTTTRGGMRGGSTKRTEILSRVK